MSAFTIPRILKVLLTAGTVGAYRQDIAQAIRKTAKYSQAVCINVYDVLTKTHGTRLTDEQFRRAIFDEIMGEIHLSSTYSYVELVNALGRALDVVSPRYCAWMRNEKTKESEYRNQ